MINRRFTKLTFLLLFCYFRTFSQFDYLFLKHLVDQNLAQEHKTYIYSSRNSLSEDSLNYLAAKYHLLYFNDTLFLSNYARAKVVFDADTNAYNIASITFLTARHKDTWFSGYPKTNEPTIGKNIGLLYRAMETPSESDLNVIAEELRPGFMSYKKSFHKHPFLAAGFSAVVPGLGQLYLGKKRSFITTLMMNLACGVQAYEAYYKLGIKKPYTLFSIGFFGLFYLSNIYGSYSDAKIIKKEKRKQLLINAARYYNINYSSTLYQ